MAAQIMEEQGIHGFVYCSQGYSEHQKMLPLPNSLIIGAINPYKAANNRILLSRGVSISDADKFDIEAINMLDVIPELSNKSKDINQETNYISFLDMSWSNIITAIGFRLVKILTTSIDRDHIETSYSGFDWETYQTIFLEDILCYNFDIFLTGLLRELFLEYSFLDWEYMKLNGSEEHPIYDHGDFPNELVDIIHSQFYVREFIRRLQNPYYRWED